MKITDKMRLDWLSKMRLWVRFDRTHFQRKAGISLRQQIDAAIKKEAGKK